MTSSIIRSRPKKIAHSSFVERTQAGIGPLGQRDGDGRGGGQGAALGRRAARSVEPGAELAAPVGPVDVEAFDAERRDVDRQALAGLVEHRAGHRRAARVGHAFALVDADVQQIADETLAIVDAQQRQRLAALGQLDPFAGLALPSPQGFPLRSPLRRQRHDAVALSARSISARADSLSGGAWR